MPKPRPKEKQKDYILRCMADKKMAEQFPDTDQRLAVCYSYYTNK